MEVERCNSDKIILHLCASKYGSDTRDYREAGYDVRLITEEIGVENYHPPKGVYGIIANPPCTMFSIARTSHAKVPRDLREGMRIVHECLRIIWEAQYDLPTGKLKPTLKFWALENPATGLLKYFLGKPRFVYSPHEFGDTFSKRTALWGNFNEPQKLPLFEVKLPKGASVNDMHWDVADRKERTDLRSIASPMFTKAFFEANR
jgi:hypothetical protein